MFQMKGGDPKRAGIEVTERVKHWAQLFAEEWNDEAAWCGTCTATRMWLVRDRTNHKNINAINAKEERKISRERRQFS